LAQNVPLIKGNVKKKIQSTFVINIVCLNSLPSISGQLFLISKGDVEISYSGVEKLEGGANFLRAAFASL